MIQDVLIVWIQRSGVARHKRQSLVCGFQELDTQVLAPQFDGLANAVLLRLGNLVGQGVALRVNRIELAEVVQDLGSPRRGVCSKRRIDVLLVPAAHFVWDIAVSGSVSGSRQVERIELRINRRG